MKNKSLFILPALVFLLATACKKQLDVQNPNSPTPVQAKTESGIIALGLGAVYQNGFNGITDSKYNGSFLGDSYWFLAPAYHELMGDVISAEAANNITNQISVPDYVILDGGTKISNTAPAKSVLRLNNSRTKAGNNPVYYEWAWMYFLNNACNQVLNIVDAVNFSGNAASKKSAVKAWCFWWKGFAYSHIGSLYYAGLANTRIDNSTGLASPNNNYLAHDAIIAVANASFDSAIAALNGVTNTADFSTIVKGLIPSYCLTGHGGVLTPAMWIRNINTMKARNLLVNKRVKDMTAADWNVILALTGNGIQQADYVFTGRTASANTFFSASGGSVAALTTGNPTGTTYKITERAIQDFKSGDQRLTNNFAQLTGSSVYINQKGGFTFSTRYKLLSGGNSMPNVISLSSLTVGAFELFLASTYEENLLMRAEAKLYTGDIDGGLLGVDSVRSYQGAGLAKVSGTGLALSDALEELRKERRAGLLLRGLSFYDARRWGVIDDISKGGGRTGCTVVAASGAVSTNATINYNFLDYWDVPDDESTLNPPSSGSAPIKNPN